MVEHKIKTKKVNKTFNKKRGTKNPNKFDRVCLKDAPLKPLNTGAVKVERKKSVPKTKKAVSKRPKLLSKKQSVSPPTVSKRKLFKKNGKNKKNKHQLKPSLPTIKESSEDFCSEVVFNPRNGCLACEEGRKGEGDSSCWACRLHRLQTITDRVHNATKSLKCAVK